LDWVGLGGGKGGEVGKRWKAELAGAEDEDGARGGRWGFRGRRHF
jgi:hypothetical protein